MQNSFLGPEAAATSRLEGPEMDPVAAVLRTIDEIPGETYAASGMVRVAPERRVAGRAFLPVGRGHAPDVAFPLGGVMVVGQDFGTEKNLDDVLDAGEETDVVPTWRQIHKSLHSESIPTEACWFTNYVMGVRRGRGSNCAGRSPGLRRGALRRACADLFVRQLLAQQPCALIVLGTHLPPVLAADFPRTFAPWAATAFSRRDCDDGAVVRNATMGDVTVPIVVSIVHPSMRGPNLATRRFGGCAGAEAERSLLRLVRDVVRERWYMLGRCSAPSKPTAD